jgi:23S rRNA pseudouridine955/2504/2580 synthase
VTILTAAPDDQGRRLDRLLRKALPGLPLSLIHRLLREGKILVDGRPQGAAFRVQAAQEIAVPEAAGPARPAPRPGALEILYESGDFLVLNKEAGLPVHGAGASLDARVQAYLGPKLPPSLSFRPGPLHRLDKPTSGVVVFSVSLRGARWFSALLQEGGIHKQYLALVEGEIAEPGLWEDRLLRDRGARRTLSSPQGKPARTRYTPLAGAPGYSLLVLEPETGRTHQIRAQAAAHGHPLGGDAAYGGRPLPAEAVRRARFPAPPFLLHAWKLIPPAPVLTGEPELPPLEAPPPDYFHRIVTTILGPSWGKEWGGASLLY